MIRPIVFYPNPILTTPAQLAVNPDDIQETVANLLDTLDQTETGVGLAAPQIGVGLRIFVVSFRNFRQAFINPTILRVSDNETSDLEGCLSLPGREVRVTRPKQVWLTYFDEDGKIHQNQKYKKMEARIIQHEYDHILGKLIIDYE